MRGSRLSRGKDKRLTSVAIAGRLLAPAGPNGRSRHLSRWGEGGGATSEDRRGGKRLGGDAGRARLLSSAPVRALALFLPVYCSPSSRPRASTRRPHSVALCIPAPRPLCLCMRGRDGACACVRARRHEPNEASEWQPNATAREARSALAQVELRRALRPATPVIGCPPPRPPISPRDGAGGRRAPPADRGDAPIAALRRRRPYGAHRARDALRRAPLSWADTVRQVADAIHEGGG